MTFPRPEPEPEAAAAPAAPPLTTFTYKTYAGRAQTVEAHLVSFMPAHVAFWRDVGDDMNVLVLAEANTNVHELREMQ